MHVRTPEELVRWPQKAAVYGLNYYYNPDVAPSIDTTIIHVSYAYDDQLQRTTIARILRPRRIRCAIDTPAVESTDFYWAGEVVLYFRVGAYRYV